jgi:hypothetical protein
MFSYFGTLFKVWFIQDSSFIECFDWETGFTVVPDVQYSQRHSVIYHCDRHITLLSDTDITLLSDTDISFGLFNLFTYFDMPFEW